MTADVESVLSGSTPAVRVIAARLLDVLRESLPGTVEEVDASARLVAFTYRPGTYAYIVAGLTVHTAHVNLMFASGASLVDADRFGLLEGRGKKARHITMRSPADVDRPGVRELVAEADRHTARPDDDG